MKSSYYKRYLRLVLFSFVVFPCAVTARSQDQCAPDRDQFEKMNRPMFVGPKSTAADAANYEKTKDTTTEALHRFLIRSILSELRRVGPDRAEESLPGWISCVQSGIPQYARLNETPGVPAAYLAGTARIMLVYEIDRGYEAIPQLTYFFEVYSLEGALWKLIASKTPHQFDAASLNVSKVAPAPPGDYCLLLTGKHYGDTGARLYLELLAFDGHTLRELWSEVKPRTWVVSVKTDTITLGSEEVDRNGHNAREVTKTFRVEKHGLKGIG
jgi:hypothetical protein